MERIASRSNPLIAHVRKLASSGAYRRECGAFVCDGPKLLREALLYGGILQAVLYTDGAEGFCTNSAELPPIPSNVRVAAVPPDIMRTVSPSKTPQGVLCVCAIPDRPAPQSLSGRRYVVLDAVQDPGNVGTILRTADAFGADGAFLLDGCASVWNPKTIRATMGAAFRAPSWNVSAAELGELLRRSEIPLYGAALGPDARNIRDVDFSKCAVAIGSEGRGLSETVLSMCAGTFRIPMNPRCESLNAAIAAAVILWEAARLDNPQI